MILEGRHVTLRPLEPSDAGITLTWRLSDRASLLNKGACTFYEQLRWIETRPVSEYNFVICLKDGRPVGMVSLVDVDLTHRRAEPARFMIGDEAACKGRPVAFEATLLVYKLAFDTLGLHRVYGPIAGDNTRMVRYHEYLGMTVEGRQRDHYWLNGKWQDAIMVGLNEDEYRTVTLPKLTRLIGVDK